jgi:hypothetical protein
MQQESGKFTGFSHGELVEKPSDIGVLAVLNGAWL